MDKSLSKTAEEVLKAAALFALASAVSARLQVLKDCDVDLGIRATAGILVMFLFLFMLGIAILIHRLRELYPWIFVGPDWFGKLAYVALGALFFGLLVPAQHSLFQPIGGMKSADCVSAVIVPEPQPQNGVATQNSPSR